MSEFKLIGSTVIVAIATSLGLIYLATAYVNTTSSKN